MQGNWKTLAWQGYGRQNGKKGIRNRVLVLYTVKCAEFVAQRIVAESGSPDVELVGFDGCTDNQYAVNLLISLIRHPNVGAVLAVGLGCEYVQPERLADIARREGKAAEWMFIQNEGGTAIFEEIVEAVGLDWLLLSRAASERARLELRHTYDKALEYCKSVRQYSVSPGNFAGGLSTIEEKSMGAVVKSGSRPIQGVLKVAEPPRRPGLWLLDSTPDPHWMQYGITNPNDNEGLMDLASCGAHIVFLVTGRGSVVGSAVAPCIKITGNGATYARMSGDMDFDASSVLRGGVQPG